MRSLGANAAKCANYRARLRDQRVDTINQHNQRIASLEAEVASLGARIIALEARRVDTDIERNQSPRQSELPVEPRARGDNEYLSKSLYVGEKKENQQKKEKDGPVAPPEFWPWWDQWRDKVARKDAVRAYIKARRQHSAADLMTYAAKYISEKPVDRPWMHAATFLNGRRWEDEPAPLLQRGNGRQSYSAVI